MGWEPQRAWRRELQALEDRQASSGVQCRGAAVDGLIGAVRAGGDANNHDGPPTNQLLGYGAAGFVISHAVKSCIHYVQHDSVNCFWTVLRPSI